MSSISPISTASLPADIRAAGTGAVKDYKTAVGFERCSPDNWSRAW